jgi:HSP20 family protein
MINSKDAQVKGKKEAKALKELTHAGPVFIPAVDIFENKDALILIADMPGIDSEGVDINLKDSELTISARPVKEERNDVTPIYTEYESGGFLRSFTLSNVIDQARIEARMKDGVLKVILPKAESAKPRQIVVQSG